MDPTGPPGAHAALAPWANYYVITGSAAAALTGLQFVVQTLIAQRDPSPRDPSPRDASAPAGPEPLGGGPPGGATEHATAAFGSPTVVHFSAALLLSAALSAPWPSIAALRGALLAAGVGGLAYAGVVLRRTRRQTAYRPVLEDWVWHVCLPAAAYGAVAATAALVPDVAVALFAAAGATLLLLCVGIHNAWDTVAYLSARPARAPADPARDAPAFGDSGVPPAPARAATPSGGR